jgi:hypothetical protein
MSRRTSAATIEVGALRFRLAGRGRPAVELVRPRLGNPLRSTVVPVEVQLKGRPWRRPVRPPRAVRAGQGIVLTWTVGKLELRDEYQVASDHIERTVRVTNRSSSECQLVGVRMLLPGLALGDVDDCRVEAPATSLRPRLPLSSALRRRRDDAWTTEWAPAAKERWGRGLEDSPDVTPGLMALHNHRRKLSFLAWYHSDVEAGTPLLFGAGRTLTFGHQVGLAGWMAPGQSLIAATQVMALVRGDWAAALKSFRSHYLRVGILPALYGEVPDWVRRAAVYEVHPGQFGGFAGLTRALPALRRAGFTVIYLLPVMRYDNRSGDVWDENWLGSGSPYAIKDFEAFEPTLGTEKDFRRLVDRAHRLGLRLLMDFVPQGCATDARYVDEHPEWFCRDEAGRLVSSHGWVDTYSLDWANRQYQDYMLTWSLRLAREFNLDGFRIDAPHAKEPNWDRAIPYHASATSLGVLPLLDRLQEGLKRIAPDRVMLCELFGPIYVRNHDFQYDYHPCTNLFALLRGELSVAEIGAWFEDYWAVMPPGACRLSFTETHDTRLQMSSYAWRGSSAERSLLAILVLAGFVPMVWSGQEHGSEGFYRKLLAARAGSSALLFGERRFNPVGCSHPDVLSIVCRSPAETVWGVVSLHAERTPVTFSLPPQVLPENSRGFQLFDLIDHALWSETGRSVWDDRSNRSVTISPEPYVPYFFRISAPAGRGRVLS